MDVLQNIKTLPAPPQCSFTISPPGAQFSYTISGITYNAQPYYETFTNVPVTFTGSVVLPPGVSITKFVWNMGDGTELYGQSVIHTYIFEAPETRVSFCVTDNYRRTICVGQLLNLRAGLPIVVGEYIIQS